MTKLQAIREFCSFVCEQPIVITRKKYNYSNMSMDINNNYPRITLPFPLDMKPDAEDKEFRKDIIKRFPSAKGFSHITLSLLHECGHWATRSVMNILVYENMTNKAVTFTDYINIPYERLATDWAICWLCCPANRQFAKEFERKYFSK